MKLAPRGFVAETLATECVGHDRKNLETSLKPAGLPRIRMVEQFDRSYRPCNDSKITQNLAGHSRSSGPTTSSCRSRPGCARCKWLLF